MKSDVLRIPESERVVSITQRIPPDFVKRILKDMIGAVLECPNGRIWNVELQKSSRGTFFKKGWREFVKHHSLEEFDLLVFGYDGNQKFSVRIYDRTACERDEVCDQISATKTFNQVNEEEDFVQGQLTNPKCHSLVKIKTEDKTNSGANEEKFSEWRLPGERMRTWQKQNVNAFTSKLPYFTRKIKKAEVFHNRVRMPNLFWRQHLTRKSAVMLLRGPDAKSWEVNYIYRQSDLTAYISGGWPRFLKVYNIVEGDVCVFELVSKKEMQVHIFHI